jgi:hypothetical protein
MLPRGSIIYSSGNLRGRGKHILDAWIAEIKFLLTRTPPPQQQRVKENYLYAYFQALQIPTYFETKLEFQV